jgi:hypothetical protein
MARLAPGATRLVSEVRRLGRSGGAIMTRIETLVMRQMRVVARKAGLRLTGTHGPQGLLRPRSARHPALPRATVDGEAGS